MPIEGAAFVLAGEVDLIYLVFGEDQALEHGDSSGDGTVNSPSFDSASSANVCVRAQGFGLG
jgi:hypothetical protein